MCVHLSKSLRHACSFIQSFSHPGSSVVRCPLARKYTLIATKSNSLAGTVPYSQFRRKCLSVKHFYSPAHQCKAKAGWGAGTLPEHRYRGSGEDCGVAVIAVVAVELSFLSDLTLATLRRISDMSYWTITSSLQYVMRRQNISFSLSIRFSRPIYPAIMSFQLQSTNHML